MFSLPQSQCPLLIIATQHWALFNTGSKPPAGGFHNAIATPNSNEEEGKHFDLWYSFRPKGEDNLGLAIAAFYVGTDKGVLNQTCASEQKLLEGPAPYGGKWTCRSWDIEVLYQMQQSQINRHLFSIELLARKRKSAAKPLSQVVLSRVVSPIPHDNGSC